jgi:hypothetical protein
MFAKDSGDTNLQFMHNDGSGTATKVDLGVALTVNKLYEAWIEGRADGSGIDYTLRNVTDGTAYSGSVTTDLPASDTALYSLSTLGTSTTTTSTILLVQCQFVFKNSAWWA